MKFKCCYEKENDSNEGEICSWYGKVVDILEKEDGFEATITGRGSSFHVIVGKQRIKSKKHSMEIICAYLIGRWVVN